MMHDSTVVGERCAMRSWHWVSCSLPFIYLFKDQRVLDFAFLMSNVPSTWGCNWSIQECEHLNDNGIKGKPLLGGAEQRKREGFCSKHWHRNRRFKLILKSIVALPAMATKFSSRPTINCHSCSRHLNFSSKSTAWFTDGRSQDANDVVKKL